MVYVINAHVYHDMFGLTPKCSGKMLFRLDSYMAPFIVVLGTQI